jgi:DNA repair photolyase
MDNTCLAGCRYCYVLLSHETAVANFRRHDPAGVSLR